MSSRPKHRTGQNIWTAITLTSPPWPPYAQVSFSECRIRSNNSFVCVKCFCLPRMHDFMHEPRNDSCKTHRFRKPENTAFHSMRLHSYVHIFALFMCVCAFFMRLHYLNVFKQQNKAHIEMESMHWLDAVGIVCVKIAHRHTAFGIRNSDELVVFRNFLIFFLVRVAFNETQYNTNAKNMYANAEFGHPSHVYIQPLRTICSEQYILHALTLLLLLNEMECTFGKSKEQTSFPKIANLKWWIQFFDTATIMINLLRKVERKYNSKTKGFRFFFQWIFLYI